MADLKILEPHDGQKRAIDAEEALWPTSFHSINIECSMSAHAAIMPSIFAYLQHIKEKHIDEDLGVHIHSSALEGILVVPLK